MLRTVFVLLLFWTPQPSEGAGSLWQASVLRKGPLCGVARRGGDMVTGATETEPHKYPWMVHITISYPRNTNKLPKKCGGSLIDQTRIVTGSNCFFSGGVKFEHAVLTFGAHNTNDYSYDELFIPVTPEDVTIHPDYHSPGLVSNDIAIVFLHPEDQAAIPRTHPKNHPKISPICLPSSYQDHAGTHAVAVGWGRTRLHGPVSPALIEVDLTIVSLEDCRNSYAATEYSRTLLNSIEKVICAGSGERKGDACTGFSGGPLMLHDRVLDQYEIIGVTSWGLGCGDPLYPGIYTRVDSHLDWIAEQNPRSQVTCEVSDWRPWGSCSRSCGGGTMERTRDVIITPEGEGEECPSLRDSESCNEETCPENCTVEYGERTVGECRGRCGKLAGSKTVTMTKVMVSPARFGGELCDLTPEKREEGCTTDCCPANCEDITTNSSCSATCGPGKMTVTTYKRTRIRDSGGCHACSDPEIIKEEGNCTHLVPCYKGTDSSNLLIIIASVIGTFVIATVIIVCACCGRNPRNQEFNEEETEMVSGNRGDGWNYGMIIGNSEYGGKGLSNLPTIRNDRKLIVDRLGNKETYHIDFTNSEHPTQIDDYTNVEDIIGQVEAFMDQVEANVKEVRGRGGEVGTLLMFYLGHGGKVHGVDCVIGVDGKPYPVNSILHTILDKRCAKKVIMILDCCRNKLDPNKFILSDKEINNAQEITDFSKVIHIWSTEETHKATALSGATFSEALCEVLEKNPDGVKMTNLERILNKLWREKQRQHPKIQGRVVYTCKVDLNGDYVSMFPC